MLTTRGWWFLLGALALLALGVFAEIAPLAPAGLALVLWLAMVGLVFYARARLVVRQLVVERLVADDRGPVESLWAGRPFEVQVVLRLESLLSLPFVAVADRVPLAAVLMGGEPEVFSRVARGAPLTLRYRVRPPAPGRVRFEGLRLRLADLQGLFHLDTFVPAPVEYRVLPVLADAGGRPATHKRHNLLPPPGIHRLRRAGSGSELLDLRDYMPGDPPKTIAWKVSARRDRLVTKEFESEVPVRTTLFVDTSNSVRVGPRSQNALARLVEIAAAVAQANTGKRDLTGLVLFDEQHVRLVRPARSPRHLVQVLHLLADAAGLVPTTGEASLRDLLPLAYAFAEEVYPPLLRPDINEAPFWLRWFGTRPPWTQRRPGLADRLHAGLLSWAQAYGLWSGIALMLVAVLGGYWLLASAPGRGQLLLWLLFLAAGAGGLGLGCVLLFVGWQFAFPGRRRDEVRRKRLAALLSVQHDLAPGGIEALLADDEQMALHLQRFLAEHHVPFRLPLYDADGRYVFTAPQKADVLARALTQAVGKGHDNELFVLLADLIELADRLDPLLRAVRVALARHHQVVILCPWPPGVPVAVGGEWRGPGEEPSAPAIHHPPPATEALLRHSTTVQFHRSFAELKQTFGRMGVSVICAASEESVRLILDRIDRLRMVRRWP
jgi:uncharacterized protein (DUF58 family)